MIELRATSVGRTRSSSPRGKNCSLVACVPSRSLKSKQGQFVSTVEVGSSAGNARSDSSSPSRTQVCRIRCNRRACSRTLHRQSGVAYEVQELSVELGQQVQAGQLLAKLSNHQSLYVVGHAFKREASFLEQAAQERRPIDIEFAEDDGGSLARICSRPFRFAICRIRSTRKAEPSTSSSRLRINRDPTRSRAKRFWFGDFVLANERDCMCR